MCIISEKYLVEETLLQGNEAIARGALEAGVSFCAGYPGNPSSEIIERLAEASKKLPVYVEWSINEKVALEAATAASFSGCRGIASMKQNGINVVSDFLTNLTMSGTNGGLVLVSCDDPAGISSTNEEDSRAFARLAGIPLLEPSTPQEALEMTKWAFELSEKIKNVVMIRSVSRLSHTRSNVKFGHLPEFNSIPYFDTTKSFNTFPVIEKHTIRQEKLIVAEALFNDSHFNQYRGNHQSEMLIITSGSAWNYALETIELLGLKDRVGVLKLGTTWPLPAKLLEKYLKTSSQVLFAEEVDPFIEDAVKSLTADLGHSVGIKTFYGKASGHIPACGELSPGLLTSILTNIFEIKRENEVFTQVMETLVSDKIPVREFGFCPGCPHRASYYAIKTALSLDGRDGFVSGDIGCYTMGIWPSGFGQVKSVHAMGSGLGLACGYGKLERFGFKQPVITVCGDSTFFHAGLPPLINAKFNRSDILLVVLDNSATAMTGFQPHPGSGVTLMGEYTEPIDIQSVCESIKIEVKTADPYQMNETAETILALLSEKGPRVLILKRKCALVQSKQDGFPFLVRINTEKCLGEKCGCNRYCTRIFRCPGLIWDNDTKKAGIDYVICVGCGICTEVCPQGAIVKETY